MMSTRFKLSAMMFLEFFIWGAWFPLVFGYLPSLGFNDTWEQPLILNCFNIAALVALFFSTQFADRNFSAEKFLAFSQLVGGAAILALFWIKRPDLAPGMAPTDQPAAPFWPFFALMLVHCLFYVPTISITNSIAFANLRDPKTEFGPVRLWGTIGWIAASWPFVFILVDWSRVPAFGDVPFTQWLGKVLATSREGADLRVATSYTFIAAGAASLLLAVFSLFLPHTPPKPATEGRESFAWLEAVRLLKVRYLEGGVYIPFLLVLFVVTFFDSAVHQCYFVWTGRYLEKGVGIPGNWVMPVMSIGQIAEIGTMAILGYVLKTLGWRTTMVIGILGHAARFAAFAFLPYPEVAIAANLLHGICYAFFFATVYIFVDEYFPKDARSSAQGLFNVLILGVGPFVGTWVSVRLGAIYALGADNFDFKGIFLVPCVTAIFAAALLLVLFRPAAKKAEPDLAHFDKADSFPEGKIAETGIKAVDLRIE
jgi:nucleoside transporter